MRIINSWNDYCCGEKGKDVYFTVEIDNGKFVDVKYPNFQNGEYRDSFSYIMDCELGGNVYSYFNESGDGVLTDAQYDEIIKFVDNEAENYLSEV